MKLTDIFVICLVLLTYNRDFRFKKEIMVCAAVYLQIIAIYVLSVSEKMCMII